MSADTGFSTCFCFYDCNHTLYGVQHVAFPLQQTSATRGFGRAEAIQGPEISMDCLGAALWQSPWVVLMDLWEELKEIWVKTDV